MSEVQSNYQACAIIEGFDGEQHCEEDIIDAFQFLINSGVSWSLQGFYGRTAASLIESGQCSA
jgi:hypothetical protein